MAGVKGKSGVYKHTSQHNLRISVAKMGHLVSAKTRKIMSMRALGRIIDDRAKEKMRKAKIGGVGYWRGKKRPEYSREKHHFWKGGICLRPYPVEFSKILRQEIRNRDGFKCAICKKPRSTSVHHIDYDKNNCSMTNLITLCRSCHGKTNSNRDKWKLQFNELLR